MGEIKGRSRRRQSGEELIKIKKIEGELEFIDWLDRISRGTVSVTLEVFEGTITLVRTVRAIKCLADAKDTDYGVVEKNEVGWVIEERYKPAKTMVNGAIQIICI